MTRLTKHDKAVLEALRHAREDLRGTDSWLLTKHQERAVIAGYCMAAYPPAKGDNVAHDRYFDKIYLMTEELGV